MTSKATTDDTGDAADTGCLPYEPMPGHPLPKRAA